MRRKVHTSCGAKFHRAAVALLVGAVAVAGVSAGAREYETFDVVGDSVSFGINPDYYSVTQVYGWVDMLFGEGRGTNPPPERAITNLWPGIAMYNTAVSGSKAWEWADTNSYSYLGTVLGHRPDLVAVMIGGNDFLAYAQDGNVTEAEKAQYETNLTTIIQILRGGTPVPEIVLVGYYDLFDGLSTNPLVPAYLRMVSYATEEGNRLIKQVATSNGCFYVNVCDWFMHHCYGEELGDTDHLDPDYVRTPVAQFDIHPVTAGHRAIYERVMAQLGKLKEIPRFEGIRAESGQVVLRWTSGIAQDHVVEVSTNLAEAGGFRPVVTNDSTPPMNVFTDALQNAGNVFYRIRAIDR